MKNPGHFWVEINNVIRRSVCLPTKRYLRPWPVGEPHNWHSIPEPPRVHRMIERQSAVLHQDVPLKDGADHL